VDADSAPPTRRNGVLHLSLKIRPGAKLVSPLLFQAKHWIREENHFLKRIFFPRYFTCTLSSGRSPHLTGVTGWTPQCPNSLMAKERLAKILLSRVGMERVRGAGTERTEPRQPRTPSPCSPDGRRPARTRSRDARTWSSGDHFSEKWCL